MASRGSARNFCLRGPKFRGYGWPWDSPPTTLTKSLDLHDYHIDRSSPIFLTCVYLKHTPAKFLRTHTHTHTHTFYGPFSGTILVSRCQKNLLLDFMVQGEISEADIPTVRLGATPSGLISDPPPSSPIFTPDALPAKTLPVYRGLGQACWLAYPVVWLPSSLRSSNKTNNTAIA